MVCIMNSRTVSRDIIPRMLTAEERESVWENQLQAEVRAYYFGDLASSHVKRKQIITGCTFFLSSGAAAILSSKAPSWIPLVMSAVIATVTAYSIATGLDRRILSLSKLHVEWNHLSSDYENLYHHYQDENACEKLEALLQRARDASERGVEMPYDERKIEKWTKFVYARFEAKPV